VYRAGASRWVVAHGGATALQENCPHERGKLEEVAPSMRGIDTFMSGVQ
jgi:hypothetical protein